MLPIFLVISDEDLVLDSEKEGEKYIPFVWGGEGGHGLDLCRQLQVSIGMFRPSLLPPCTHRHRIFRA